MTKRFFLATAFTIGIIIVNAQNEVDALRYSMQNLTGTARYSAMGGAFGSLGGEFSNLSANPAGIGMYQYAELSLSPTLQLNSTKSYFKESHISAYNSKITLGSLGIIFSSPQKDTDWKRINFGIGWNQLASFDKTINIKGVNSQNSIVDRILTMTNGTLISDLASGNGNSYSEMAWNTYLIDPALLDGEYISNFSSGPKRQSKTINSSGGIHEFLISIGSTYQEKLYIGATIGFPTIDYYEYSEYTESDTDTSNNLRQMMLSEEISAIGKGYNFKAGVIYRLSNKTKIGGAIHTPTFFNIEEDYNTSMATFFKDSTLYYSMGYLNLFSYDLITPLKASLSASTIFNNFLISGEYEIIDYSTAEYFNTDFENINQTISSLYKKAENIRFGTEITLKPCILRLGYAKFGNPFIEREFSLENFSYGIGINNGAYFIDISYILSKATNTHLVYSENPISLVETNHKLLFTLGFRY